MSMKWTVVVVGVVGVAAGASLLPEREVGGEHAPRPTVKYLLMSSFESGYHQVSRSPHDTPASFPAVKPGQRYTVELGVDFGTRSGRFEASLAADCGGLLEKSHDGCTGKGGSCYVQYVWTVPASDTACTLTGLAAHGLLADRFSARVPVERSQAVARSRLRQAGGW